MDSDRRKRSRGGSSRRPFRPSAKKRSPQSSKARKTSAPRKVASSFVMPVASRRTVQVSIGKKEKPELRGFLLGLLGCALLMFSGFGAGAATFGLALLFSGTALLVHPPKAGFGKALNLVILGIVGVVLFAFLPLFYWTVPEWRQVAAEEMGLKLPLILSVQPRVTFEALLLLLAGVGWLYSTASWKLNHKGRGYLYFAFSGGVILYCASLLIRFEGLLPDLEYAGGIYFLSSVKTELFLLGIAGAMAFGYGSEGWRERKAEYLSGIIAAAFVYGVVLVNGAVMGFYAFISGLAFLYLLRLRRGGSSLFYKVAYPLFLIVLYGGGQRSSRLIERQSEVWNWLRGLRDSTYPVASDALTIFRDFPLFGVGLGNFEAVFPQYRNATEWPHEIERIGVDWIRFLSEGGLLLAALAVIFLVLVLRLCLRGEKGHNTAYREIALTGLLSLLIAMFFAAPLRQPGIAFFGIILLVWALPRKRKNEGLFRPLIWRIYGGFLILFGLSWVGSGWFGTSGYSSVKETALIEAFNAAIEDGDYAEGEALANELVELRPLSWVGYFNRGLSSLEQLGQLGFDEASLDFQRARFVEPTLGDVTLAIGDAWLNHEVRRTVTAWRETLQREIEGKEAVYSIMLAQAHENFRIMRLIDELTSLDPNYRAQFIESLDGAALMREIEKELNLSRSLDRFSVTDRTRIVRRWAVAGDVNAAEDFVLLHAARLENPWMVWSLIRKGQARFEEAVDLIRRNCAAPEIPPLDEDFDLTEEFAQLERSFSVGSQDPDPVKGATLLQIYLYNEDYENALKTLETLLEAPDPADYIGYWLGEMLFRLGDDIESWYAFADYLDLE